MLSPGRCPGLVSSAPLARKLTSSILLERFLLVLKRDSSCIQAWAEQLLYQLEIPKPKTRWFMSPEFLVLDFCFV
jgi:hypothetical protein